MQIKDARLSKHIINDLTFGAYSRFFYFQSRSLVTRVSFFRLIQIITSESAHAGLYR